MPLGRFSLEIEIQMRLRKLVSAHKYYSRKLVRKSDVHVNADSSARSVRALLVENLFALAIPAVEASASPQEKASEC